MHLASQHTGFWPGWAVCMAQEHRCCNLAVRTGADAFDRTASSTLSCLLLQVAIAVFNVSVAPGHNTRSRLHILCGFVFL